MKTEMKANLILKPNHPTARDIVNAYTASEMVEKLKDLYCVNDAIATDAGEVLIAATETVEVHINLFGEYPSIHALGWTLHDYPEPEPKPLPPEPEPDGFHSSGQPFWWWDEGQQSKSTVPTRYAYKRAGLKYPYGE